MTASTAPHPLTLQMLAWLATRPRTYAETMDAWRTSCPKFPIWEDALSDHLIRIHRPTTATSSTCSVVELTPEGWTLLDRFETSGG